MTPPPAPQPFKAAPKTVVILGVPFHDVTMDETLAHIDGLIAERTPRYLATANLDFTAQASEDVELQRILLDAYLVLCDGTPLIWASKWLRAPIRERVAGSDLMPVLTTHCAKQGHRMFLLGATKKTLQMASDRMLEDNPDLVIAGTYAPPVAKLIDFDNDEILRRIDAAKPDVLIVCFGCPKQEKWIYMNIERLNVPVSIGLGATLDFVAGNFKRAPVWMRKTGFEWVFRLMQEPRRLFNRYLFDLLFFVTGLRRQRATLAAATTAESSPVPAEPPATVSPGLPIHWSGRIDAARVLAGELPLPAIEATSSLVVLELSEVSYLDSTGLGLLIRYYRECKTSGGQLFLLTPSKQVVDLLAAMKLDRLIPTAESAREIEQRCGHSFESQGQVYEKLVITFDGDLVAKRCEELHPWVETSWREAPRAKRLVLDLERVSFMDSSGLGMLVALHRMATARDGGSLQIESPNPNVLNVIKIARLDALFELNSPAS